MPLNDDFRRDPETFLSGVWDIRASAPQAGATVVDSRNIGRFNLRRISATTIHLVPFVRSLENNFGLFSWGGTQEQEGEPLEAYYLASRTDSVRSFDIAAAADFFFTDTITGCMFAAYGRNRHRLTVVHSNALNTGGQDQMHREAEAIRASGHTVSLILEPEDYRQVGPGQDGSYVTVSVIGWRRADGWHFYYKRRYDDTRRHLALDAQAVEI